MIRIWQQLPPNVCLNLQRQAVQPTAEHHTAAIQSVTYQECRFICKSISIRKNYQMIKVSLRLSIIQFAFVLLCCVAAFMVIMNDIYEPVHRKPEWQRTHLCSNETKDQWKWVFYKVWASSLSTCEFALTFVMRSSNTGWYCFSPPSHYDC